MKRLVLEMENEMHQAFKEAAVKSGFSMRKILQELVTNWIAQEAKTNEKSEAYTG